MTARSAGGKGLKCLEDAPEGKEARCPQYFIKWARYSHIHNTWESDVSLEEKACKGLKILENYQKKQQEVAEWSVNFKIMYFIQIRCTCLDNVSVTIGPWFPVGG